MSTPLVSDEQIERMAGDPIAAQAISSYEFGKCIGTARGLAVARNIYEAELQSMRDRLSRMEEAGNAMREFIKDGIQMSKLPDMPLRLVSGWDALSNK